MGLYSQADFKVNDHYVFEVGGRTKNASQIKDIANAYTLADDKETGIMKKIPLWLFAMMY